MCQVIGLIHIFMTINLHQKLIKMDITADILARVDPYNRGFNIFEDMNKIFRYIK